MKQRLKLSVVQTCSNADINTNLALLQPAFDEAVEQGSELLCFPEVVNVVQRNSNEARRQAKTQSEDPFLQQCCELARQTGVWVHVGSLVLREPERHKLLNRSLIINGNGDIVAHYDKIHLFDVELNDGSRYCESNHFAAGDRSVVVNTPWGGWGLAICYDIRFPGLFNALAQDGASVLFTPAAFTVTTGQAHWHSLLRSRAIENACYVVAAAQCGRHQDGRQTFGHSLVIDPWGEVVQSLDAKPGQFCVELDLNRVSEVRAQIPTLQHQRRFSRSVISADE